MNILDEGLRIPSQVLLPEPIVKKREIKRIDKTSKAFIELSSDEDEGSTTTATTQPLNSAKRQ
jgi:hypothetical protein